MTAALEGSEWSAALPGRTLPPEKTRYPFYRRLGGPQYRSGGAENLVPTGIRSRTVQPVAQSLYRLSYPDHRNWLVKHVTEGKIEVTRRGGRRRKQLLDDLKEKSGWWELNEEALDRTVWRTSYGRCRGPVVRQTTT